MPAAKNPPPAAPTNVDSAAERFPGFEHFTANFLYCPNQFFDVCLPYCSRGAIRLVAHLLRRTLGWLDEDGQPRASRVTVWKKTGTTFASLGGGAMYPLNDHGGITAELKGVFLFPSSGMSVSLQAGYTHGF